MRLPEDLWEAIGQRAGKQDRPRTRVVVELLKMGLAVAEPSKNLSPPSPSLDAQPLVYEAPDAAPWGTHLELEDGTPVDELEECPWTAIQLSNKAQITVAGAQRHIDRGTWKKLL